MYSRLVSTLAMLCALLPVAGAGAIAAERRDERYIIHFEGRAAADAGERQLRAGGALRHRLRHEHAVAARLSPEAAAALKGNPGVTGVEPDPRRYPIRLLKDVPSGADQPRALAGDASTQVLPYGLRLVQADQYGGNLRSGMKVCVVDSGYDITHEDRSSGPVTGTNDPRGSGPWDEDGDGHGTHVAGTVNAADNAIGMRGVFPDAPMHIIRVFGDDGEWAYSSDLVNALDDCLANGAKVINMSLGGLDPSQLERSAFRRAERSGVISVAAAGNDGDGTQCSDWPGYRVCALHYPAAYPSVISVGAVNAEKGLARFSQINAQVDLAAPGVAILSTVPVGIDYRTTVTELTGNTRFDADPMEGAALPDPPVTGELVACKGLAGRASDCAGAAGKVCLIKRGTTTFAEKSANCVAAGGIAAIVYNNVPGSFRGTLGEARPGIPVVGITDADGATLLGLPPGTGVRLAVSSSRNYDTYSGTSMAAPHVAGVAALVWSTHPACRASDVRNALTATALDLGAPGPDSSFGFGLVQTQAASAYLDRLGCAGPVMSNITRRASAL